MKQPKSKLNTQSKPVIADVVERLKARALEDKIHGVTHGWYSHAEILELVDRAGGNNV